MPQRCTLNCLMRHEKRVQPTSGCTVAVRVLRERTIIEHPERAWPHTIKWGGRIAASPLSWRRPPPSHPLSPHASPMDRYVVIGNPVAHSLSPAIHAAFAAATGERLEYETLLVPLGEFARGARAFFDAGGSGANVTLPFKVDAFAFADRASERAQLAGAANFLMAREGAILADNTDGAGLVADLRDNQQVALRGARILLLGAGGAARGVIAPLLAGQPSRLVIANRTPARAEELAARFSHLGPVEPAGLEDDLGPFDVVVNATSSSTHG